jgi:RsiW-degrading membrane proteinase PrsW (M82 family)
MADEREAGDAERRARLAHAETAAPIYLEAVQYQLEEERRRRSSLEQRGATVTATAASLSALLFTLAGLSLKDGKFSLPWQLRYVLVVVVVAFVVAAGFGLWVSVRSGRSLEIDHHTLEQWIIRGPGQSAAEGSTIAAKRLLQLLDDSRARNQEKAFPLRVAFLSLLVGIVVLIVALAFILIRG